MIIVFLNLPILVVDHSVNSIKTKWGLDVICVIVTTRKSLVQRHVKCIKENGINISRPVIGKVSMVLEECYKDKEKFYLSKQLQRAIHNLMMSPLLRDKEKITLVLLISIV